MRGSLPYLALVMIATPLGKSREALMRFEASDAGREEQLSVLKSPSHVENAMFRQSPPEELTSGAEQPGATASFVLFSKRRSRDALPTTEGALFLLPGH